jgi:thioesterase domain-containing protein
VVAYEIAQQLRAAGEETALLTLFDCVNPAELRSLSRREVLLARLYRQAEGRGSISEGVDKG